MLRRRRNTLWCLSLLLAALCGSCAESVAEVPLSPEEVLPPGYDERKVPTVLFESLGLEFNASNQGWARGFVWNGDWAATVSHIEAAVKAHSYTLATVPLIQSVDAVGIKDEDYIRDYVSPGQTIEIVLINLDIMRKRGTEYDTSAKYLLMSGNRAELLAQIERHKKNLPPPLPDNLYQPSG
jgi:hypothetical protein